jgi:hypothetical protein
VADAYLKLKYDQSNAVALEVKKKKKRKTQKQKRMDRPCFSPSEDGQKENI